MSIQSDSDYKPDFEILDRYLNFSSELLRISLLAIGGYGTIMLVKLKDETDKLPLNHLTILFTSICIFTICAGASLFHRYFATDSMSWYISYLRAKENGNTEKANIEKKGLHKSLNLSSIFLIVTEVTFAAAVLFFAAGIYQLINLQK